MTSEASPAGVASSPPPADRTVESSTNTSPVLPKVLDPERRGDTSDNRGGGDSGSLRSQVTVAVIAAVLTGIVTTATSAVLLTRELKSQEERLGTEIQAAREDAQRNDRVTRFGPYLGAVDDLIDSLSELHAFLEVRDGDDGLTGLLGTAQFDELEADVDEASALYRLAEAEAKLVVSTRSLRCIDHLGLALAKWEADLVGSQSAFRVSTAAAQAGLMSGDETSFPYTYESASHSDWLEAIALGQSEVLAALRFEIDSSAESDECNPVETPLSG